MVVVACEQHFAGPQRLIHDELAVNFLPAGLRLLVRACRWPPVRDLLIRMTEKKTPGIWAGMACRKRYIDDKVAEAVKAGVDAVVILGAGLDTRAYRLVAPSGVDTYEVDLSVNVTYKRARLETLYGRVPPHVTLVSADLEVDDLGSALAACGLRNETSVMFVWEGVTQYLTEAGARKVFASLSTAGAGSRLVFTFVLRNFIDGTRLYGAERLYRQFVLGQVWHYGIAPQDVDNLLREYGWTEREQVGSEVASIYVEPTGRHLPVLEIERIAYAEKC